ncbi:INCE protein, partial [Pedionomus torquatus]|nr:INCE protein [Pedionomus torquatus]
IKNFIKHSTPTRPNLKSELLSLQEKERQRLESLRKKQEAEEQRRKKVEEEKRRRQAEMKQKREERLRKALQARERVEQMEEEKKKRMEQKIVQNDDKVRLSQVREEKGAEERSRRKLSKKPGEADAWKQKAPRGSWRVTRVFFCLLQEEDEQQEALQKRREDEGKEKGDKVLELRNLVEQQQVEQGKERYWLGSALEEGSGQQACFFPQGPQTREREDPPATAGASSDCRGKHKGGELEWSWDNFSVVKAQGTRDTSLMLKYTSAVLLFQVVPLAVMLLRETSAVKPMRSQTCYCKERCGTGHPEQAGKESASLPWLFAGSQLNQAVLHQYYHPLNVDQIFGLIPSPKLEDIFGKTKPRYFKRTSSAVWHSPP